MMQAAAGMQGATTGGSMAVGTVTSVCDTVLTIKKGANEVTTRKVDGETAVVAMLTPPPVRQA
jgi:hypothetical protein